MKHISKYLNLNNDITINNNYEFNTYVIDNSNHIIIVYLFEMKNSLMIKSSLKNLNNRNVIDTVFIEHKW